METVGRSKKSIRKIKKLIVMCSLMVIVMAASTYAWFVGMRTVSVSSFDVEAQVTDSLLLSINGSDWSDSVAISKDNFISGSYEGNTNKWAGRGLIPMSTVGGMDTGASRMKIFEKASVTTTPGGYRLLASRVDNFSNPTSEEPDGYVVFDLFIKNFSGTQYLENLNILDEEAIYLTVDSEVNVAETGVADTGIENSVRVAFAQIGRVIGTSNDADLITSVTCASDVEKDITGICRTAQIWEPNDTKHTTNAISWYNASCLKRTGADVTNEANYGGACKTIANGFSYPTYAVSDDVTSADNVDIYDGTEYNWYTPNSKTVAYDTFSDTDKLLTGTDRPAFMMLAPNSITKVRVYIYIEGQDIDNYDFAQIGKAISIKFGFTKERFKEEDIKPVLANENCFVFNSTTSTITNYYAYENNVSSNPECPKSIIIPSVINGTTVTKIGNNAFKSKGLLKVVVPNTVISIGTNAFQSNQITNLKLSNNLNSLGIFAFNKNKIKNLSIPASLTSISGYSFSENEISSLIIQEGVTNIGYNSFEKNLLTAISIPASVKNIESSAFSNNKLTSLVIPNTVETLGWRVFSDNLLTSVTLPNNMTTISNKLFLNNLITSVNIPSSVTTIEAEAFRNNKLTSIILPNSVETIGNYSFSFNSLTNVTLSSSMTSIPENAFYSNKISMLSIPNSITSIGMSAFQSNQITSLNLSDNITNLDVNAFSNNKLTSLSIPESLTILKNSVFYNNLLTSVTIPSNIQEIGSWTFGINNLTNVTIPSSVMSIGSYSFYQNNLSTVCIKGKSSSAGFTLYGSNLWTTKIGTQPTITWNCPN